MLCPAVQQGDAVPHGGRRKAAPLDVCQLTVQLPANGIFVPAPGQGTENPGDLPGGGTMRQVYLHALTQQDGRRRELDGPPGVNQIGIFDSVILCQRVVIAAVDLP